MLFRMPTDVSGGQLVTLLRVFTSSSGFPCSEYTFVFCGENSRTDIWVALRKLWLSICRFRCCWGIDSVGNLCVYWVIG